MKLSAICDMLENNELEYRQKISDIASDVFYESIKPYCDKHGYKFCSGNGGFFIEDTNDKKFYHDGDCSDVLPAKLMALLEIHVDGGDSFLGEWMPNVRAFMSL